MEDALRPNKEAFKEMYERGYLTWASLWESGLDLELPTQLYRFMDPSAILYRHPHFPPDLKVDLSYSNGATVSGKTCWQTSRDSCDLPPFQDESMISIATKLPTPVILSSDATASSEFLSALAGEGNHVAVLVLAWTYVLSARWAELIPGACISKGETLDNTAHQQGTTLPKYGRRCRRSRRVSAGVVASSAAGEWQLERFNQD